jgi:hypothetical protein
MVAALVVRDAVGRLAHNLSFVITGILLVFASYTWFPFQQRTDLQILGWIYIGIAFATILTVLIQIKRNPVIASLTTPAGAPKATWDTDFVLKVTVFALLPLFTLFAAQFPGSETSGENTYVFEAPDLPTALTAAGYRTICFGGVGFFNPASALGKVLPGLFGEAHWERNFGVTAPDCFGAQVDRLTVAVAETPPQQPLFTFINVAALHQPNKHYLPGATEDTRESHAAALEYVDSVLPRLFTVAAGRGRPCQVIICSDHGTLYGEDGHTGHRVAHEHVWTVPYADFVLEGS